MGSTQDKVILVTGGARRLGRVITQGLAASKYILHYHQSKTSAIALKAELENQGTQVEIYQADFKNLSSIEGLFHFAKEKFGRIDVLINNASLFERVPFHQVEDFQSTFNVNLIAPLLCSKSALSLMSHQSLIINICDTSADYPFKNYPLHSISKAALEHATKALALELAPKIRVNALVLGMIMPSEGFPKEEFDRICKHRVLLQRPGMPEEVVSALEFIIQNEYMNASVLHLDGGQA